MVTNDVFEYLFKGTETLLFQKKLVPARKSDKHLISKEHHLLEQDPRKELKELEWSGRERLSLDQLDLLALIREHISWTILALVLFSKC